MRVIWILAGGLILGFGIGFVVRDLTIRSSRMTGEPAASSMRSQLSPVDEPEEPEQRDRPDARRRQEDRRDGDRRDGERPEQRTRPEALAALKEAIDGGDRGAMHEALRDLSRRGGEPLSAGQLEELGSLLHEVDDHMIEELAHALVMSGGQEGIDLVMAFVGDPDLSLHARERALHGLSRVPREMADEVYPYLADFLESGPPPRLQHDAARAIGNLYRDDATGALLGLLEDRPGVRPDVVYNALGDTGSPADTETLLGLLAGDRDGQEKMGLLRAISRISTRAQDPDYLLEMMQNPPAGVSRSMVAQAIGDSSHDLGTDFLKEALRQVSGDSRAQERLARALTESGGRAGLDALLEVASDPSYKFDDRALARSLHDYRNRDGVPLMMDMISASKDEEIIEPLARGMFRSGGREATDQLLGLLESGNVSQRRAIAHSLHDLSRDSVDMDRLATVLRSERSHEVIGELAHAMSRMDGDRGVREVESLLQSSSNLEQRHALMWGLESALRRNSPRAKELFVNLATGDPAPEIRRHAVEIIQHRRDPAMIPTLRQMLGSETNPEVQRSIRRAIERLEER